MFLFRRSRYQELFSGYLDWCLSQYFEDDVPYSDEGFLGSFQKRVDWTAIGNVLQRNCSCFSVEMSNDDDSDDCESKDNLGWCHFDGLVFDDLLKFEMKRSELIAVARMIDDLSAVDNRFYTSQVSFPLTVHPNREWKIRKHAILISRSKIQNKTRPLRHKMILGWNLFKQTYHMTNGNINNSESFIASELHASLSLFLQSLFYKHIDRDFFKHVLLYFLKKSQPTFNDLFVDKICF